MALINSPQFGPLVGRGAVAVDGMCGGRPPSVKLLQMETACGALMHELQVCPRSASDQDDADGLHSCSFLTFARQERSLRPRRHGRASSKCWLDAREELYLILCSASPWTTTTSSRKTGIAIDNLLANLDKFCSADCPSCCSL
ncbi:uncharacterized protein LOC125536907 [Triticum urartu]|uniref:uncharacterized protein LOC125536907 n=1 Tax=Triticum urartu TaxID=4572 RepID=UPI002042E3C3|nr:uncharacterized protein LOC125536907 [Triticum urartu]